MAPHIFSTNVEFANIIESRLTTRYAYDELDNLLHITLTNSTQIDYLLDGSNRRIGKKLNDVLVQAFHYQDQLEPIAELDGNNNLFAQFIYGSKRHSPDHLIKGGQTYRVISDHLGSPRLIVNTATGATAQRIDYDGFGIVPQHTNPGFQPFGFAGRIYDSHIKLTRFGARDYDPQVGRWTAKDPIHFRGSDHSLYRYLYGNPMGFVDPQGTNPSARWIVQKIILRFVPKPKNESSSPGLPPKDVKPPVENPEKCTVGPSTRGNGESLWDENRGEWRYKSEDQWHNPHWDYNRWTSWNSPWQNVPIGSEPPIKP